MAKQKFLIWVFILFLLIIGGVQNVWAQGPGELHGTKFEDLNGNGQQDLGEPGLPGWTIELFTPNGVFRTTVTDENGHYWFMDVPFGDYGIREVNQPGWVQTHPAPPGVYEVVLDDAEPVIDGLDFGNQKEEFERGALHGRKYDDQNGNGTQDAGEPGLPGWTIVLLTSNGVYQTTVTDQNGNYWFTNLPFDDYIVREVPQFGWMQTEPRLPTVYNVVLGPNQRVIDGLDFGNQKEQFESGSIHGTKYHDQNGNGVQDAGEPGLPDWRICIEGADGVVHCTITDADGNYWFMGLFPGKYKVYEDLKNKHGWSQTQPKSASSYEGVEVVAGQPVEDVDFGNIKRLDTWCRTHWDVHIPPESLGIPTKFWMRIINHTNVKHTYDIDVFGLQGVNGIGLIGFTTAPPMPVMVPAGGHVDVLVSISPNPVVVGNFGEFEVIVTNLDTGWSMGCGGVMWSPKTHTNFFPQGTPPTVPMIPGGQAGQVGLPVRNLGVAPVVLNFQIMAMIPMEDEMGAMAVAGISLNDQPPGTPVTGTITIPAAMTGTISVDAMAMDFAGPADIIYELDATGEGDPESVSSLSVDFMPPPIYLPMIWK